MEGRRNSLAVSRKHSSKNSTIYPWEPSNPEISWARIEGSATTDINIQWSNVPLIPLHFPSPLFLSSTPSILGLQSVTSTQQWRTWADFSPVSRGSASSISWRGSWPLPLYHLSMLLSATAMLLMSALLLLYCYLLLLLLWGTMPSLCFLISSLSSSPTSSLLSGLCILDKETVIEILSVAVSAAKSNCYYQLVLQCHGQFWGFLQH